MELWEYLKASIYGERSTGSHWPDLEKLLEEPPEFHTSIVEQIKMRTLSMFDIHATLQATTQPQLELHLFSSSRCVFGKCPQALSLRWAQTHKKNYRLTTATFSPWQVAAGYSGALSSSQVDGGLCFLSGHCELHPLNNDGIGQGECVVLCGKICSVASYQ